MHESAPLPSLRTIAVGDAGSILALMSPGGIRAYLSPRPTDLPSCRRLSPDSSVSARCLPADSLDDQVPDHHDCLLFRFRSPSSPSRSPRPNSGRACCAQFHEGCGYSMRARTFVATSLFCFVALVRARRATAPLGRHHPRSRLRARQPRHVHFFIHRTGRAMQADTIITNVYGEFTAVARRLLPERGEGQRPATDPPPSRGPAPPSETSIPVIAEEDGFLQVIGLEAVADKARDAEATVRFLVRPGHYLFAGRELARIELPAAADEDERKKRAAAVAAEIRDAVIIGPERTPEADLEFCLLRLVEIAQRALSPGINDPTTAMRCIDRLTSAFVLVAGRDLPEDPEGVESLPVRFEAMFEAGFNPIRQCAERLPQVALRLAEQIRDLAPYAGGSRAMLRRQIELLAKMPSLANWADLDAEAMAERVKAAEAALAE
ncbi:MAG: DUF2254 family protein [Verrucomicrobiales bacterium]